MESADSSLVCVDQQESNWWLDVSGRLVAEEDLADSSEIRDLLSLVDQVEVQREQAPRARAPTPIADAHTQDVLKRAIYQTFGSSRCDYDSADKSNSNNSSVFLRGQLGKDLLLSDGQPNEADESVHALRLNLADTDSDAHTFTA